MAALLVEFIFDNKVLFLSYCLFILDIKKNLVYVSCLFEHGLIIQFDFSISIKSNGTYFIFIGYPK